MSRGRDLLENQHIRVLFLASLVGAIFIGLGATSAKDQGIRHMTRTGRPAGKAAFVDFVERLTDRDLSRGKPGRPVTKDK